jgi:branched-chain amino acid transport system ATP-binding protein
MAEAILQCRDLSKRFGGVLAIDGLGLTIAAGEVHAIIGPNGAGKSTLLGQLAGEITPTRGSIWFAGQDITPLGMPARALKGIARSFQITSLCPGFTAIDNVALAVQARAGHSFRFWRDARRDPQLREQALEVLHRTGLAGSAEMKAADLGHGEQRQLELAVALAARPKLLLLDEPLAGMGRLDAARMIELLRQVRRDCTIVLVEHDMDAVFALADRISVLVYGRCIATGEPAEIRANDEVRQAYLGNEAA